MASIERRDLQRRDKSGRVRTVTRYKVRYRDLAGRPHSETKRRLVEAERRKAEIELELGCGTWLDPRRGEMRLGVWAADWLLTRHDLRATTHARLATTLDCQVLPRFGSTPLAKITKRRSPRVGGGDAGQRLSAATVRKAVFALRQCLAAAMADRRIAVNPAVHVPLPSERGNVPRYLSQDEVERLVEEVSGAVSRSGAGGRVRRSAWG